MKKINLSLSAIREFKKDPRLFVSKLVDEHGDAFMVKGLFYNMHFISNTKYIQHILFDEKKIYIRPPNQVVDDIFMNRKFSRFEEQARWRKERLETFNSYYTANFVKNHVDKMVKATASQLDTWQEYVTTKKPIAINLAFLPIALKNLSTTIFSDISLDLERVPYVLRQVSYLLIEYEKSLTKLPWTLPGAIKRKTRQYSEEMLAFCEKVVDYCLSDKTPEDNIFKAVAKKYTDKDEDIKTHLRKRAAIFLIGSIDTIGFFMMAACIKLSLYPLIAQKVREEVKTKIGDRAITMQDIDALPYTRAVMLETLRLDVLPFLPRMASEDDHIDDYFIKKNDRILIPIFYMNRRPEFWENPEGFNPDRFLNPLDERYRYLYLPFGGGPRGCMGKNFAVLQMTIILAMVAQRYRLDLVPPYQPISPDYQFIDPDTCPIVNMTVHNV